MSAGTLGEAKISRVPDRSAEGTFDAWRWMTPATGTCFSQSQAPFIVTSGGGVDVCNSDIDNFVGGWSLNGGSYLFRLQRL